MPNGNNIVLLLGTCFGIALMLLGIWIGLRVARIKSQSRENEFHLNQGDRERILQLLRDLGIWMREYSLNVVEFQELLEQFITEVRGSDAEAGSQQHRAIIAMEQVLRGSRKAAERMDTAEYRLEKQTAQIQSYIKDEKVDSLTGLANRHAFDLRLEELCREYRESGKSFVLALIDLDQMKWLYEQHGHQAGDLVLRQICNMICSRLEHAITVARFGGGEFSVIVDGSLRDAAETMNQVRSYLQSERINLGSEQVKMTVSVGLSELGTDVVAGPLLRHADEALYTAKKTGGNRVYYHDGNGPVLVGAPETVHRTQ